MQFKLATLAYVKPEGQTGHPAHFPPAPPNICTVLPFSGIWHQTSQWLQHCFPQSRDKEKLVLSHTGGFGKDHSPSLSLSPHSLHTFLQTYLWFQGFPSLTFTLSIILHYWGIDSCFWSCHKAICCHPTIRFSKKRFCAFFLPPFLPLLLVSSSFLCVNFSVPPTSELTSGSWKYYALVFPVLPHVPSIPICYTLNSIKMKSSDTISFPLCADAVSTLAQWSPARVPNMGYGMVMCNTIIFCIYVPHNAW